MIGCFFFFFFSSRRRHTRFKCDWSSDVCSSDLIGGTDPARDLELGAFERRKHVVTANKELVAKEWKALHEAARLAKRELRFEAAVAAAVPVIAGMRGLGAVRPRVLRGLLNGTTTYICSRMETGKSPHTSSRSSSPFWRAGISIRITCAAPACAASRRRT